MSIEDKAIDMNAEVVIKEEKTEFPIKQDLYWDGTPRSDKVQYIKKDGFIFTRGYPQEDYNCKFFTLEIKQEGHPGYEIVCECGSHHFLLNYGEYEIKATCTKCGMTDVVYDG